MNYQRVYLTTFDGVEHPSSRYLRDEDDGATSMLISNNSVGFGLHGFNKSSNEKY